MIGGFIVAESPRWLFRRGRKDAARAALLRSRSDEQATVELREMEETAATRKSKGLPPEARSGANPCCSRKYVIPFVMACVILACNQATGINSIIGYNPTILLQAGLSRPPGTLGLRHPDHR